MKASNQLPTGEQPLLQTKLTIPQMPIEFVQRPHLTERINTGVKRPLTLIAVPVGFGKTHLLLEWTYQSELSVAWLNVDSEDNDPVRFFHYLICAIQKIFPGIAEDALDFIQSTRAGSLQMGLTVLINEIAALQEDFVLVLDDFQNIQHTTILESICFILKHNPGNLHLIVASRTTPMLDLTALRAKAMVIELTLDDLRFTTDEVGQFCQQVMGLDLSPEAIQDLSNKTDGWVTALQLAAVSMRSHKDPNKIFASLDGDSHYLVDFLAEEVLDQQPDEIRQFLLRSSVLDTLNSSLVEAVVKPNAQPGYGTVMLNRLTNSHLFISALDEKHEWYRYHQLFLDFLRHIQAEINPEEIPVLQKRAAEWFEQNANFDEAFRYAFAANDPDWTTQLLERNIQGMIQSGDIMPLIHWIGKMPAEIIRARPILTLGYAWGAIATYQLDLAQDLIDNVQNKLMSSDKNHYTEADQSVLGGLAICQSTLALFNSDIDKATELSNRAITYLKGENPLVRSLVALDNSLYYVFSGDTRKAIPSLKNTIRVSRQTNNLMIFIIASVQLAEMQVLRGQLTQAWATLQKAKFLAVGPEGQEFPITSLVDIGEGTILLEKDRLEEASVYLERGSRATRSLWIISSLDGLVALAQLRQYQGDISEVKRLIDEVSQIALSTESSQWDDILVSALAVRLALLRNDLSEAGKWWAKGGFPGITEEIALEQYPYHIYEYLKLIQARYLLSRAQNTNQQNELQFVLTILESLMPEARNFNRVTSQIEIMILQSLTLFALKQPQAKEYLLKALAMGEPEGYRRIYLNESHRIYPLLQECLTAQQSANTYLPSPEFITSLLNAIKMNNDLYGSEIPVSVPNASTASAFPTGSLNGDLSQREIEVLRLIAQGKSNKEISSELYLALNTVKRHAYNIYNKLGVNRRTQAVSRARSLGLIP